MSKNFFLILLFLSSILFVSFNLFAAEKKEKTEITGDKMVIKNKGKVSVFKGNAKVVRGNYKILADEMKYFKDTDDIDAKGNIRFFVKNDDGSSIKAKSSKAKYNTKKMNGMMWGGKPRVEYFVKGSTDTVVLYMNKLYLRDNFESAKAVGNVRIISSSGTIHSDNAVLNKDSKSLFMKKDKKKPQVNAWQKGKKANFKADEISLLYNEKIVKMDKNVEGKIIFDNLEVEK
ncbi:MAG: LPS-assembly protein LptD [Elusimicrobia bacterium]|nr:LPS-assembly protein LptD [Elusimicrobiota bacterium]